jgi:hypothetical protein
MTPEVRCPRELFARHLSAAELAQGLAGLEPSPRDVGVVRLIVRRPRTGHREVIEEGELDTVAGLVGDNWRQRGSTRTADGSAHPDMQINLMNARVIDLIAGHPGRWPLAGDQFFVGLDLGPANVPPGTRLALGSAVIEVTNQPHTGCAKFVERFGLDAMKFVNSPEGRARQLRGINARVISNGRVRTGGPIRKLPV